jgi:2-oxoglutarate dehydrogenase E2 component (dihydrolipoamide succinyltransferase)
MNFQIKVPAIGESINEATIGRWLKDDGSVIVIDDILCELESEKATIEIVAEQNGILKIRTAAGETVKIGAVIAELSEVAAKADNQVKKAIAEPVAQRIPDEPNKSRAKISPVAANILKQAGVGITDVQGSGLQGRIVKNDVISLVEQVPRTAPVVPDKEPSSLPALEVSGRTERRERMSTLRKTISRRMLEAKQGAAMLTTFNEVDMSAIMEIRKNVKERFKEKYNVSLGFMSFFTKAATIALQEFPVVNAAISNDEIVYHDYCDIGMAVSTDRGLVVPVIRNAEKKSLAEIEQEVAYFAVRARENKITIDEMSGGTFSITNGGVFGSLLSTPIINSPQAAILGMHNIQERPVARNGQIVIRPMMYIALSYDHRLIDGRDSVRFVIRLKEILEEPFRILLAI